MIRWLILPPLFALLGACATSARAWCTAMLWLVVAALPACGQGIEPDRQYPVGAGPDVIDVPQIKTDPAYVDYLFEGGRMNAPYPDNLYPMVHVRFPAKSFFKANAGGTVSRTYGTTMYMYYHPEQAEKFTGMADAQNKDCLPGSPKLKVPRADGSGFDYHTCSNELTVEFGFSSAEVKSGEWDMRKLKKNIDEKYVLPVGPSIYPDWIRAGRTWDVKNTSQPDSKGGYEYYYSKDPVDRIVLWCEPFASNPGCLTTLNRKNAQYMFIRVSFWMPMMSQSKQMLDDLRTYLERHVVQVYRLPLKQPMTRPK